MEYIMETDNLVKRYGAATVVDHVTLHVPKGKIYGLLGQNGAGKTTIMSMLLNLTAPTQGHISLFGKDYRTFQKEAYSRIGSMIETPGFYHNLTGWENLEILARLRGRKQKTEIKKALQKVGLEQETEKYFGNYSLGMKQRLGIAAAIMHDPELLILDEPINGLDPVGIAAIRNYLDQLCHQYGTTILISSHILSEMEQLADVIGVISEGKLLKEVTKEKLQDGAHGYLEFEVSNAEKAENILKQYYQNPEYRISGQTIRIYDMVQNSGEINTIFVKSGLTVTKINHKEETLEDIFLALIGGNNIA